VLHDDLETPVSSPVGKATFREDAGNPPTSISRAGLISASTQMLVFGKIEAPIRT
jgi:hypothetical protein